jgi:hypothetical protein
MFCEKGDMRINCCLLTCGGYFEIYTTCKLKGFYLK